MKESIVLIATSGAKQEVLNALKTVQDQLADVRVGEYSIEARMAAIESIQRLLVIPIESYGKISDKNEADTYK